ncbi:hypothetical protein [Pseudoalteromonas marina]|uniref:hypothetical protein n=1 Tax=Pseudoalteromonas marina TaxID=267375 RepID=UPI003C33E66D
MADPEIIGGLVAVGTVIGSAGAGFFSSRKRGATETEKITKNASAIDAHATRLDSVEAEIADGKRLAEETRKSLKRDAQQLRSEVHDGFQAINRRMDRTDEHMGEANRGISKLMDRLLEDTSPGGER